MANVRSVRAPEKLYRAALWLVSFVFAGFLIGLGNLIIGDLPAVDQRLVDQAPTYQIQGEKFDREITAIRTQQGPISDELDVLRLQLEQARRASSNGSETFSAWIAARTATTDPQQDPEVLARTKELEQLKANERNLETRIAALENEHLTLAQQIDAVEADRARAYADAQPALDRDRFLTELRVFGLRLLICLPMLVAAGWMVLRKRESEYWPLMRGFVIAAIFVFFVELVPYLPSYGGYIRYVVGLALTVIAAHYVIKHLRSYLNRRQESESEAEEERRKNVSREEAFKKMADKICPGCDRPTATTGSAEANFCVHCGLTLFDHCGSCNTRKMAFFRYCMTCGTNAANTGDEVPVRSTLEDHGQQPEQGLTNGPASPTPA